MTPKDIASLVLQMNPSVFGKTNKEVWMIEKAAEIGMLTAFAKMMGTTMFNNKW